MDNNVIHMSEYNTYEKVLSLFNRVGELGTYNNIFAGIKDSRNTMMLGGAVGGMVNGMEFPFDGLLINQSDKGIGLFYLKQPGIPLTYKLEKMNIEMDKYIFIPKENIKNITIKKFAILNLKTKCVKIETTDKTYKLIANIDEKAFPYHAENFARFMGTYNIQQPVQQVQQPVAQQAQTQPEQTTQQLQQQPQQINFDPNTGMPINNQNNK